MTDQERAEQIVREVFLHDLKGEIGTLARLGVPLADDAVVFVTAGLGAVGAEVNVVAVERDDRLSAGPVLPIFRVPVDESGHDGGLLWVGQNGKYRFALGT